MKSLVIVFLAFFLVSCSKKNSNEIIASGTIETIEVTVGAKTPGQLLRRFVDEGSVVHQGDTLAIIDHLDLELQLKQAEAAAQAADAQYRLAVKGTRPEDIVQAQESLKKAQADYKRMKELIASRSVSQQELDNAHTQLVLAQKNYEKLRNGMPSEGIESAKAMRDEALAQVESIRKKIRDSYIIAPSDGIVTQKSVEPGELLLQNAAIVRIAKVDPVHLVIYVTESDLARIKLGSSADVNIDGAPGKIFTGKVVYISPVAEFTPKNIQTQEDRTKLVFGVKIDVPNPDGTLKPGMPADAKIKTMGSQ